MKIKNKAKNIKKYSNNKRYEYKNDSNMTLSQTSIYIYIYMLFHFLVVLSHYQDGLTSDLDQNVVVYIYIYIYIYIYVYICVCTYSTIFWGQMYTQK